MRTNLSSSTLVRLLGEPMPVDADASGPDTAERLSLLLGVSDAVALHAAHQSVQAAGARPPATRRAAGASVDEQVHQARYVLAKAIRDAAQLAAARAEAAAKADGRNVDVNDVGDTGTGDAPADFAPWRQCLLDQQRNMALMIGPLRAHVREALSSASPRLRQLAALDATWEQMLGSREQKLLSAAPALLKRRFDKLRKTHANDEADPWRRTGGWLHAFGHELEAVLLAELDVRLEPVTGLMEAFRKEIGTSR